MFGKIAEHTGKNKPYPNVSVWPTFRQFLDAEHSYSAETGKSCFGESLDCSMSKNAKHDRLTNEAEGENHPRFSQGGQNLIQDRQMMSDHSLAVSAFLD